MGFVICAQPATSDGAYRCTCCGFESDDIDRFAFGSCWSCSGGDMDCLSCIAHGVEVSQFTTATHRHLMDVGATTRCGLAVTASGWTGPGDLPRCGPCYDGIGWDQRTGRLTHHGQHAVALPTDALAAAS